MSILSNMRRGANDMLYAAGKLVRDVYDEKFRLTETTVSGLQLSVLQRDVLQSERWTDTPLDNEDAEDVLKMQAKRFEVYVEGQTAADDTNIYVVRYDVPQLKIFTNLDTACVFSHKGDGWPVEFMDPTGPYNKDRQPTKYALKMTERLVMLASQKYELTHGCKPTAGRWGELLDLPKLNDDPATSLSGKRFLQP